MSIVDRACAGVVSSVLKLHRRCVGFVPIVDIDDFVAIVCRARVEVLSFWMCVDVSPELCRLCRCVRRVCSEFVSESSIVRRPSRECVDYTSRELVSSFPMRCRIAERMSNVCHRCVQLVETNLTTCMSNLSKFRRGGRPRKA